YAKQSEYDSSVLNNQRFQDGWFILRLLTCLEMPLEELLALYGYEVSDPLLQQEREPNELSASLPDMTLDKDQIAKDLFSGEDEEESSADDLTPSVTSHASDLLRRHLRGTTTDDIMVGSMYQAKIPTLSLYSDQERVYENEDQLLWTPDMLSGHAVEEFLLSAQRWGGQEGTKDTLITGELIKDNDQEKCSLNSDVNQFEHNILEK
uniref:Mesoderm induction early response 1, family member 2 n=1 Tax=Oncorhynchus mykiss TaxID=8022 RepID=A0A8K9UDL1_ONCMY